MKSNLAFEYNNEENIDNQVSESIMSQKVFGSLLIIIGILLPFFFDGDATGSLLLIPLGMILLVEKSKVM